VKDDDLRVREHELSRRKLDVRPPGKRGAQHLLEERDLVVAQVADLGHDGSLASPLASRLVGAFDDVAALTPFRVWDGVVARAVDGERVGFAVVELEPSTVVPEHSHDNEQLGIVLRGSVSFRVGDEVRDLGPGGTWRIAPNVPHEVHGGPEGAVLIDVFAPVRADWQALERLGARPPLWP
jgi:quercetin dioxygenase-like cupin family protein